MNRSPLASGALSVALLTTMSTAFAQPNPAVPPPPSWGTPPVWGTPPAAGPAAAPAAVLPPSWSAQPVAGAAPSQPPGSQVAPVPAKPTPTPIAASTPPAPDAEQPAKHWYDGVTLEGFVDAYFGVNLNFPSAQTGTNTFRAYDVTNGAALHWVGLNVSYAPDPIGGTVSLRFGPSAPLYAGSDANINLANVKQAFATWRPDGATGKLTIDVGKFDVPYGSEVAETQGNMNYTRGMLNWYAQPFFFTGFRVDYAPLSTVDIKLVAVNGWNSTVDVNAGKSFGTQFVLKPSDAFVASIGYMFGPEQPDTSTVVCPSETAFDKKTGACLPSPGALGGSDTVTDGDANTRFRHLIDVVLDVNPTKDFRMLFNGTYARDQVKTGATRTSVSWYGANLGIRYAFTDKFALAGRGEVYFDPDGYNTGTGKFTRVIDGTVTMAVTPTPNLVVKLEGRVDAANEAFFQRRASRSSMLQPTLTLGVVATTN